MPGSRCGWSWRSSVPAAPSPAWRCRCSQGARCCAAGTLLLDVPSDDVVRHAVDGPDVVGPYECEPYDMGVTGRDIRVVDAAYTNEPDAPPGPPTVDAWVRFRDAPRRPRRCTQACWRSSPATCRSPPPSAHMPGSARTRPTSPSPWRSTASASPCTPRSRPTTGCSTATTRRSPGPARPMPRTGSRHRRRAGGLLLRRRHGATAPQGAKGPMDAGPRCEPHHGSGAAQRHTGRTVHRAMPANVSYMEPSGAGSGRRRTGAR